MSIYRITSDGRPTAFYECESRDRAVSFYAETYFPRTICIREDAPISDSVFSRWRLWRPASIYPGTATESTFVLVEDWTEQAKEWPR